jgi:hypothetical protein
LTVRERLPEDVELAWMKQLTHETGRRVLFSLVQCSNDPEQWRRRKWLDGSE